jgi:hypothetical protein
MERPDKELKVGLEASKLKIFRAKKISLSFKRAIEIILSLKKHRTTFKHTVAHKEKCRRQGDAASHRQVEESLDIRRLGENPLHVSEEQSTRISAGGRRLPPCPP